MTNIPTGFDPSAGQSRATEDFTKHIFEDGATVNFRVHAVKEAKFKRSFSNPPITLDDCELWNFQLIISDPQDPSLSNLIFHDVVKDGRAWEQTDRNGNKWVQNKFINMLTGFGLRKSGEQLNLNPAWFTDASFFEMITGQATVQKESYNGEWRNRINWFNQSNNSNQKQPVQQQMHQVTNEASTSGATVQSFDAEAEEEDLPF